MTDAPFDFRSPHAAEAATIITDWLGRACKSAAKQWTKQWSMPVEVGLAGIHNLLPADLLKSIPETSLGCGIKIWESKTSPAFLTFDRPLLLALLSSLLAEPVSVLPEDRELTAIEQSMIEVLLDQILIPIRTAWIGDNQPTLAVIATGMPRTACQLPIDVPAASAVISIKAAFGNGSFQIVLPTTGWSSAKTRPADQKVQASFPRAQVESIVRELGVDFSVTLGRTRLTLKELANLQPGDVLVLEQRVTEPLRAHVAGKERFQVWPGAIGRNQAVRIHVASQPSKS
jgi:flagellar motor switch protein FliM